MNWKIILFLIMYCCPMGRKSMNLGEDRLEVDMEQLLDEHFVQLLGSMNTLDKSTFAFDSVVVQRLTHELDNQQDSVDLKKTAFKMYHEKMQGIQCVNGLLVFDILNQLTIHFEYGNFTKVGKPKESAMEQVEKYIFYMTRMLSVLHVAKVDAYAWQIEMFTFLNSLVHPDSNYEAYAEHFRTYTVKMKIDLMVFIDRCEWYNYLSLIDDKQSMSQNSPYIVDIEPVLKDLYNNDGNFACAYSYSEFFTIPNLMLIPLYRHHKFIVNSLTLNIGCLSELEQRLDDLASYHQSRYLNYQWEMKPFEGPSYHTQISLCVRLRIMHSIWFHVKMHHDALYLRIPELNQTWPILVEPLKKALRFFSLSENIFWMPLRHMMDDLPNVIRSNNLENLECTSRDHISHTIIDMMGIGGENEINAQLAWFTDIRHDNCLQMIQENANDLNEYVNDWAQKLQPINGSFVHILLFAEHNVRFYSR